MSTEHRGSRLASHPNQSDRTFREQITIKQGDVTERLAARRRLVAFVELFADAPRKPDAIYDLTRAEPRCQLPDEKKHRLIHQGIKDGVISRERLIRYRATQLLDDLAAFPDAGTPAEALYVPFMKELAEAVDAQTVARGVPTPANVDHAVRETREAIVVAEFRCHALARGETA